MLIFIAFVFITCAPAMLQAGIVFGGVRLCVYAKSVCPQKISKTTGQKLM